MAIKTNINQQSWSAKEIKRKISDGSLLDGSATAEKIKADVAGYFSNKIGEPKLESAADVFMFQLGLKALGYNVGTVDGIYRTANKDTSSTIQAVLAFQNANGIPPNKFVNKDGGATLARFIAICGGAAPAPVAAANPPVAAANPPVAAANPPVAALKEDPTPRDRGPFDYDGGKYTGLSIVNAKGEKIPQGQGTMIWPNGNKYIGNYKDGKREGQGMYTWSDGAKYVGNYKDGERSGRGVYTLVTGFTVDGNSESNTFKTGTFTRKSDGATFVITEFSDARLEAIDTEDPTKFIKTAVEYKDASKKEVVAKWNDKKREPVGAAVAPNPPAASGEALLENQTFAYTSSTGRTGTYTGQAKDEVGTFVAHGKGKATYADGQYEDGEFKEGKFITGKVALTDADAFGNKRVFKGKVKEGVRQSDGDSGMVYPSGFKDGSGRDFLPNSYFKGEYTTDGNPYTGAFYINNVEIPGSRIEKWVFTTPPAAATTPPAAATTPPAAATTPPAAATTPPAAATTPPAAADDDDYGGVK